MCSKSSSVSILPYSRNSCGPQCPLTIVCSYTQKPVETPLGWRNAKCMLKRPRVCHTLPWEAEVLKTGAPWLTWGWAAAAELPLFMSAPCRDLAFASMSCLFRLCRLSGSLLCCFRFFCRLVALLSGRSS
jgi:hypothetical protein